MKTLARPGDEDELLRRLRCVRPESVPRWGRMTAPQMVCHLGDAFRVVDGWRPVSHATGLLQSTIVKWIALYAPMPWPPGIPTRPELDQARGAGTPPGDFAADVAELEALVRRFVAAETGVDHWRHPLFGRMSQADWLRWGYLHVDHHLRQFGA
jgi:hypothetical protein